MEQTIIIVVFILIIGVFAFETWLRVLNYNYRNTPIPDVVNDIYDDESYQKWLSYNMANFKFSMVVRTLNLLIFIALLVFGVFPVFAAIAENSFGDPEFKMVIFMGLYFLVGFVVGIFTSYYHKFKIEEEFGFNKSTKKTFIFDKIKSLLLTAVLGGGLIYLLTLLFNNVGDLFFLYAYIVLVSVILFVMLFYVKLFVPLFNKLRPLEDGELKDAIETFAKSVGYEVSKISVIDASKRSTKLNAFFSGFGKMKQIVLYDTLIEKMSTEEIVAVLAHEIGHNKHKHVLYNLIQMFITISLMLGMLVFVLKIEEFSLAFGFDSVHFGFAIIIFGVLLEPVNIVINLFTAHLSRKHEYQADRYAATKYDGESIIGALKVLSRENFSNLTPHPLYVKLTYSHPPVKDRINAIRKG